MIMVTVSMSLYSNADDHFSQKALTSKYCMVSDEPMGLKMRHWSIIDSFLKTELPCSPYWSPDIHDMTINLVCRLSYHCDPCTN